MATLAPSVMPPAPGTEALLQAKAVTARSAAKVAAEVDSKTQTKARAVAQDFEAVFLNAMFQQMFTGIGNEGPLGGGPGTGVWRSFLTDEYAKSFAKAGGVGIGDQVYRELIAQQAARRPASVPAAYKTGASP
jgi:Rod binding domain-containing protein